ncbi:PKD domain-containing protein, partial [Polluticaenibacter yanchengensis]|nr:PKD domain-containing protein [Chitinophagaceae bacterium LY-5]
MRKKILSFLLKISVLKVVMLVFIVGKINAQTDITIGTGTVSNNNYGFPCPFQDISQGSRSQYLYRASELTAAGMSIGLIHNIKFNVRTLNNSTPVVENLKIKVGITSETALNNTAFSSFAGDFSESVTADYNVTTGWNTVQLATPFLWDGNSNILIEICDGSTGGEVLWTNPSVYASNTSYVSSNNSTFSDNGCGQDMMWGSSLSRRPNIRFFWQGLADCTGTPVTGTIVSTVSASCGNYPFTLSLNGASLAAALTYQWQSSTNNSTWTNISGATSSSYTATQLNDTYYRVIITCTKSGSSATSASYLLKKNAPLIGNLTIDNSLPANTATAFKSFNDAYNALRCGISGAVILNVVNTGTNYNEQLIMEEIPGASATNTVTFKGNGATLEYLSTTDGKRGTIVLNGADHIIFDGLVVGALGSEYPEYGYGFHLRNSADSNTIKNCTINLNIHSASNELAGIILTGSNYPGGDDSQSDANIIENNTINGGSYGISIAGSAVLPIWNNVIRKNKVLNFHTTGISIISTAYTIVDGNELHRKNKVNNGYTITGISMTGTNLAAKVTNNKLHSFFAAQTQATTELRVISTQNCDADLDLENLVANNLIYNIKSSGKIYALYNMGSDFINYYYNTVILDDPTSVSSENAYGFFNTSYTTVLKLKNNIFSLSRSGSGFKYGYYLEETRNNIFDIDYNTIISNNHPTVQVGWAKGNAYHTLANWQAGTGADKNSNEIDPVFKDPASFDFTPTSAAFADKGLPIAGITTDINGAARSTTKPDIGAIEFTLPSCNTTFLAGEAFSNIGVTTCVDRTVVLNLKGNDVGLGLTYQWQSSPSTTGTWTNISNPLLAPPHTFTIGNSTLYYRASVSCNGGTAIYSVPVRIEIGGLFPAGTYTIDKTKPSDPAGSRNFNSFNDAVAAISCGIAGPVIFNVAANTYNEQFKIGYIYNTSATNTVTFQSATGVASSVELSYKADAAHTNYTVKMDSSTYFIFKNMTVAATSEEFSRVFDLANNASHITIEGLVIKAVSPDVDAYSVWGADQTKSVGIYAATSFLGTDINIKNNKFSSAAKGIYIVGKSGTRISGKHNIEKNEFTGILHQPINVQNTNGVIIKENNILLESAYNDQGYMTGLYGMYLNANDSALDVNNNNITIKNNGGNVYGIFNRSSNSAKSSPSKIRNNRIIIKDGLTHFVAGLYNAYSKYIDVVNNEISVSSSVDGSQSFYGASGIYSANVSFSNYLNNSVLSTSANGLNNVPLYMDHQYATEGGFTSFKNNAFVNTTGGPAMFVLYTPELVTLDYNLYYSSGSTLIHQGPTETSFEKAYPTLGSFQDDYGIDLNSISYKPEFTAVDDLRPVLNNNSNWALQGRGIQVAGNTSDKLGNPRSATLTGGVPDIGAFEFHPTVAPPVLTATPATPVAGGTQYFSFGTDTVSVIKWEAGSAVPSKIELQRYSGVIPPALAAGQQALYYYIDSKIEGPGNYKYNIINKFYDSWLNNIPAKSFVKVGVTNESNTWVAREKSLIDSLANLVSDSSLTQITKFTGLSNGKAPLQPEIITSKDSSNLGTRFWATYALRQSMYITNGQNLKFIVSGAEATRVTVKVHGTSWTKTYNVPAGGAVTTDAIPRTGNNDARAIFEGKNGRGILIESEKPVSVRVIIDEGWGGDIANATLLPTGTYGKEYVTLATRQFSGYPGISMGTSVVNIVADRDNTVVDITPSGNTAGGHKAGETFTVNLNRGEVYQILGDFIKMHSRPIEDSYDDGYECFDLTGTRIVSKPNANGDCYPVAVFAGSSGTGIQCIEYANGGEVQTYQQSYPLQAWGTHYLTAPFVSRNGVQEKLFNQFRVLVKDPATVVKRNGVVMTGLKNNSFYEFVSREPEAIEADKPIMVGQFMTYFNSCGNDEYTNPGSHEGMLYLSPLSHGVKKATIYRTGGGINWLNVIVPNKGLTSLTIDGSQTFDVTYPHPQNAGYTVVMKRWDEGDGVGQISCDTVFNAYLNIPANTTGYFYNLGYQVPRVAFSNDTYKNVNNIATPTNEYTCVGTQFKPTVYLTAQAATLTWQLSKIAGATPTNDITVNNPVPVRTEVIGFTTYYVYTLDQAISFAAVGTYKIPVSATYFTSAQSCATSVDGEVDVVVVPAPTVDYTVNYTGCINATAQFTGTASTHNSVVVDRWNWNFGDNTTSTVQNPTKQWSTAGTKNVSLNIIAVDGCSAGVTKPIEV